MESTFRPLILILLTVPAFLEPLSIVLIPAKLLRSSAVSWIPFESISDPDTAEILYGTSKIDVSLEVAVTTTSSISFAVSSSLSWAIKDILKKKCLKLNLYSFILNQI